jgi:hypothetical protein
LQGYFPVHADCLSGTYNLPGIPGMETNGMAPPFNYLFIINKGKQKEDNFKFA